MPRLQRRGLGRSDQLNVEERTDLWGAPLFGRPGFPDEAARRAAWFDHRDEMLDEFIERFPLLRPEAFWQFEPGIPDALRDGDAPDSLQQLDDLERRRLAWLRSNGELTDHELQQLPHEGDHHHDDHRPAA